MVRQMTTAISAWSPLVCCVREPLWACNSQHLGVQSFRFYGNIFRSYRNIVASSKNILLKTKKIFVASQKNICDLLQNLLDIPKYILSPPKYPDDLPIVHILGAKNIILKFPKYYRKPAKMYFRHHKISLWLIPTIIFWPPTTNLFLVFEKILFSPLPT